MAKRTRSEIALPEWVLGRRFLDWPETWRNLVDTDAAPMRVEEYEEDNTLVVRAEMPGLDPDNDVEITVADHTLRIAAERRQESKSEDKKGFRSEFRYGSFVRTVSLPVGATADDVKATYRDGILEVRVPINTEQAAAKKIAVTHG